MSPELFEQSVFNEVHTIHILKLSYHEKPNGTLYKTGRYVAASVVTDTHTLTHRTTTVTLAHLPRV